MMAFFFAALAASAFTLLTVALTHPDDKRPLAARMLENLGAPFVLLVLLPELRRAREVGGLGAVFGRER